MFDWLFSSAIFGLLFALLPLVYIFRKAIRLQKQKRSLKLRASLRDALRTRLQVEPVEELPEKPPSPIQTGCFIDAEQLQLMRGTVDLITYRLSLIESSIYKDLNPKPHLTNEEYIAAAQQMRDVVRRLKRMPKIPMPMPVSIPMELIDRSISEGSLHTEG